MGSSGINATYSDLMVLGSGEQAAHMLSLLAQAAIKVTAVCLTTYAAGLLTLLGTAAALSRTPLGPAQVSHSVRTLASVFHGLDDQEVVVHQVAEDNATAAPGKTFLPPLAPTRSRSTETGLKQSPIMVQHFPPCSRRPGVKSSNTPPSWSSSSASRPSPSGKMSSAEMGIDHFEMGVRWCVSAPSAH